jgi:hypothetical protein
MQPFPSVALRDRYIAMSHQFTPFTESRLYANNNALRARMLAGTPYRRNRLRDIRRVDGFFSVVEPRSVFDRRAEFP